MCPMTANRHLPPDLRQDQLWRGPTIPEIARASGVGTATVDRVLNGRGGVREATRSKVLAAVDALNGGGRPEPLATPARPRIAFLTESGPSFNRTLQEAVEAYGAGREDVACTFASV